MISFLVKKYYQYQEIVDYIFVGGLTTVVSIVSYFLFSKLLLIPYMTSTVLSWILAVLFAFFANKKIVFKSQSERVFLEFIQFVGCRLLSLGIELIAMYLMVSIMHIDDGISKILVQFIVLVLNYIFSKLFVFHK